MRVCDWFLLASIVFILCPVWYLSVREILDYVGDKVIEKWEERIKSKEND